MKGVNNIKSSEEYAEFIDRNKTSPPKPVLFKFDKSLLEQSSAMLPSSLKPNEIVVDECTIDILRTKCREQEVELKETKNKIKDKQTLLIQLDTEYQTVQFKSGMVTMFVLLNQAKIKQKILNVKMIFYRKQLRSF